MSYRIPSDAEKAINRARCLGLFASLTGCYHQLCAVSTHVKDGNRYRTAEPNKKDDLEKYLSVECENFCGKWYTEGSNPDELPHPIRIATEWKLGRRVKDEVLQYFPEFAAILRGVKARCDRMHIELNAPQSEFI